MGVTLVSVLAVAVLMAAVGGATPANQVADRSADLAHTVSPTPVPSCPSTADVWQGGPSGPWETGSNWAGGEPTGSTYVCIPGGDTVTVSADDTAAGILVETGATLQVLQDTLTITGTGSLPDSALQGNLEVTSGAAFETESAVTLLNPAGGSITNHGTVAVSGAFEQDAGTVATGTGDDPVELAAGSSLTFAGTGAGAFTMTDPNVRSPAETVSGNIAAGQSLEIQSSEGNSNPVNTVTPTGSFTNAGTIILDHASDGGEGSSELALPFGDTLTNTGTIEAEGSGDNSYASQWNENFAGDLDNQGTLDVGVAGTPYSYLHFLAGSTLTNDGGTINVLDSAVSSNPGPSTPSTLAIDAATTGAGAEPAAVFADDSGTVNNAGAITTAGTFSQGAGTVATAAGDNPVQLTNGSALHFAGTGPGAFQITDPNVNTLTASISGNIAAGQALEIQSSSASYGTTEAGVITAAGSFTSAGTITLDHSANGGEDSVKLALPAGDTLTNTGAIKVAGSPDGSFQSQWNETIDGNLDNDGILDVGLQSEPYAYLNLLGSLTNDGIISVLNAAASSDSGDATPSTLEVTGTTDNNSGGAITNQGTFLVSSATFNQGTGTVATGAGDDPVQLDSGSTMNFSGSGDGAFQITDPNANAPTETLSGNVAAGQSLEIQSAQDSYGNEEDVVTAAGSFTNAGTITLDHGSNGGEDSVELALPSGDTLTNTGTITDRGDDDNGSETQWNETIHGNLDNEGTLTVGGSGAPADLVFPATATITSSGTVNVTGVNGSTTSVFAQGGLTQSGGSVDVGTDAAIDVPATASPGYTLSGGTLAGTGTLTGTVAQTGGTVAPGQAGATGTLTLSGNYTEDSGGTVAVPINGTASGDYSVLAVTGNATLSGALAPEPSSAFQSSAQAGDSDPVFTYGGTLSGNFTTTAVSPQNTALPQITGSTGSGDVLSCSTGSFTDSPTRFAYQWNRNGSAIPGATASTYTLQSADQGTSITCTVTASGGSSLDGGQGFSAVVNSAAKTIDAVVGSTFNSGATSATSAATSIPEPAPVNPAVSLATISVPAAVGANPYSAALTACGGNAGTCETYSTSAGTLVDSSGAAVPTSRQVSFTKSSGTLPPGVTLSNQGYLSGTPTQSGTFSFGVLATDSAQDASSPASYTLTVQPGIAITSGAYHLAGELPSGAATVTAGSTGGINAVSIAGAGDSLATVTGSGVPSAASQIGLQIGHDQSGDCDTELQIAGPHGVLFSADDLDITGCAATPAGALSSAVRQAERRQLIPAIPERPAVARTARASSTPRSSGSVTVTAVGGPSSGAVLADGTVNANGSFDLTLPNTPVGQGLRVTISGGSYTSELDGTSASTSFSLSSLVDSATAFPPTLTVTPLTTLVDSYAQSVGASGTPLVTAHSTSTAALMSDYGFPAAAPVLQVVPNFSSSDTGDSTLALSVLGALQSEAASLAEAENDRESLVQALDAEISDGVFQSQQYPGGDSLGSGTLPPTAGTSEFMSGVTAFTAAYAGTIPSLAAAGTSIKQSLPVSPILPVAAPVTLPIVVKPITVGSIQSIGPGAFSETLTANSPTVSAAPFPSGSGSTFTIEVVS